MGSASGPVSVRHGGGLTIDESLDGTLGYEHTIPGGLDLYSDPPEETSFAGTELLHIETASNHIVDRLSNILSDTLKQNNNHTDTELASQFVMVNAEYPPSFDQGQVSEMNDSTALDIDVDQISLELKVGSSAEAIHMYSSCMKLMERWMLGLEASSIPVDILLSNMEIQIDGSCSPTTSRPTHPLTRNNLELLQLELRRYDSPADFKPEYEVDSSVARGLPTVMTPGTCTSAAKSIMMTLGEDGWTLVNGS